MKEVEIIRECFLNMLTKRAAIKQQRKEFADSLRLIDKAEAYIKRLTDCKSLYELLEIHKELWNDGYRNKNLGPDPYGIFRTESISDMKPEEVFLGNIFGLWTFTIPEWEKDHKTFFGINGYGIPATATNYEVVLRQYKRLLKSNVLSIVNEADAYLYEYKKVNTI